MSTSPLIVESAKTQLSEGITTWINSGNGFTVLDLEYKADPVKRTDEWKAATFAGLPKRDREREYGSTWEVYEGKPVYDDYDDDVHKLVGNITSPRRAKLISGWDGGPNDLYLAWALGLVFVDSLSVIFIDEYTVDDGGIDDFVDIVQSRLRLEWNKLGGFSIHVADQSVFTKSNVVKGGKAMADAMRQRGMPPMAGEISFAKRRQAVNDLLVKTMRWDGGSPTPRFRVHERCELIRSAMKGGYAYPKAASGVGNVYKPMPMKNEFSHIANAVEYACSRLGIAGMDIPFENRRLPTNRLRRI